MSTNNQSKNSKKFIKLIALSSALSSFTLLPAVTLSCAKSQKVGLESTDLKLDKMYEFVNKSKEFNIENTHISGYRDTKTQNLYVNAKEILTELDGLYDISGLKISSDQNGQIKYNNFDQEIIFDHQHNKILMSSTDAFQFTTSSSTTDYTKNLKYTKNSTKRLSEDKYAQLNLGDYDMKIYAIDGEIYIPFSIFNLLFSSQSYYNIYFNNDRFIGTTTVINKDISRDEYNSVMNNSRNDTEQTENERKNTYNFIRLIFDNFYGLRKEFLKEHNAKNFDEYFAKTVIDNSKDNSVPQNEKNLSLKQRLLSTNIYTNTRAYEDFIYKQLNELHSSIQSGSYFHPKDFRAHPYGGALSPKVNEYVSTFGTLRKIRRAILAGDESKIVNFHNDTAIIYLDQFNVGTNEQLNSEQAYKYDSFSLMSKALKEIEKYSKNTHKINKIILDLSINGGGSIAAMEKVAGFMTNKTQRLYFYETINKLLTYSEFKVDTNQDGNYDENDGYGQYKWYILSGLNTFSAANLLTHLAKEGKFATIIGNKSGGGMYSILPLVLPDGTSFEFSSNNAWVSYANKDVNSEEELPYTQNGVDVDIEIPYLAYSQYDVIDAYLEDHKKGEEAWNMFQRKTKLSTFKRASEYAKKFINSFSEQNTKDKYNKEFETIKISDSDSLEQIDKKIEDMEKLGRIVEGLYQSELKKAN